MRYVHALIAVDTESDAEARKAAQIVADNTTGESFHLLTVEAVVNQGRSRDIALLPLHAGDQALLEFRMPEEAKI